MDKLNVTITMCAEGYEDGSYGVELIVLGLASKDDAEKTMQLFERLFCAEEIKKQ